MMIVFQHRTGTPTGSRIGVVSINQDGDRVAQSSDASVDSVRTRRYLTRAGAPIVEARTYDRWALGVYDGLRSGARLLIAIDAAAALAGAGVFTIGRIVSELSSAMGAGRAALNALGAPSAECAPAQ